MLKGGPADKGGNNYENYWAVNEICNLLLSSDENSYIYFEKPDELDEGFEFEIGKLDKISFYQVKKHQSDWSINALYSSKIIENFLNKLEQNPNAKCVFFSFTNSEIRELIDRAKCAISPQILISNTQQSETVNKSFKKLCNCIFKLKCKDTKYNSEDFPIRIKKNDCEDEIRDKENINSDIYSLVHYFLNNVEFRIKDEDSLIQDNFSLISCIFNMSDPTTILDGLFRFSQENYCKKYTKAELIKLLKDEKNYEFSNLFLNNSLISKINENNKNFYTIDDIFYNEFKIKRKEPKQILELLNDSTENCNYIFVTGDAGTGKSIVLKETTTLLEQNNWRIISFDIKEYSNLNSCEELGDYLYSKKISPINILANLSQGKKALLVLDQLDSISTVSGRNTENWSVVNKLLKEVSRHENIKIILACRTFDLEKDMRLKEFKNNNKKFIKEINISKLDDQTVKSTLIDIGVKESVITKEKIEFFSLPLHLKILNAIYDETKDISFKYKNRIDLFDAFWERKEHKVNSANWFKIIEIMVTYLNRNKCLSAPSSIFAEYRIDFNSMLSENVFTLNDKNVSFFHETFFDHCFAKLLVSDPNKTILDFITDSDQSLFIRSNVRQALEYLRLDQNSRYLKELNNILNSFTVRNHIKFLILDLLVKFEGLPANEIDILNNLDSNFKDILLKKNEYMPLFFLMWNQNNNLIEFLKSDDKDQVKKAIDVLLYNQGRYTKEIEQLLSSIPQKDLKTIIISDIQENSRLSLTGSTFFLANNIFFEIVLEILGEEIIDPKVYLDRMIYNFKANKIDLIKVFQLYKIGLEKLIKKIRGEERPDIYNKLTYYEFEEFIKKNPKLFLDMLIDKLLYLIDLFKYQHISNGQELYLDKIFWYRSYDNKNDYHKENIFDYFETAFINYAQKESENFWNYIKEYKYSKYETILFLILRGLFHLPVSYSNKVIDYVINTPSIYNIGYSSDNNYLTMQLINKFSQHCSEDYFEKLVNIFLNYKDNWEYKYFKEVKKNKQYKNYSPIGLDQGKFLNSIDQNRLSKYPVATRKLEELKRKFNVAKTASFYKEPEGIKGGWVSSPITRKSIQKMTNKQWINAIKKHNGQEKFSLDGGPLELSRELEEETKLDPDRFIKLAFELDQKLTHPYFYEGILNGLSNIQTHLIEKEELIKYCYKINKKEFAYNIIRLIRTCINTVELSDELINIIIWYAENHPSPETDELQNDIDHIALNCRRGQAAELISRILWRDVSFLDKFLPTIYKLVNDLLPVRAISVLILFPIYNNNRDLALELFKNLVNTNELIFTSQHYVQDFMSRTRIDNYKFYSELLGKLSPENSIVKEFIAITFCHYGAIYDQAKELAQNYVEHTDHYYRIGSAKLISNAIKDGGFIENEFIRTNFIKLLNDDNEDVRKEADNFIYSNNLEALLNEKQLISNYIKSKSFIKSEHLFVHTLKEIPLKLEHLDIYKLVVKEYIKKFDTLVNNNNGYVGDEESIFDIILKIYEIEENTEILNLIDEFLTLPTYLYKKKIDEFERLL